MRILMAAGGTGGHVNPGLALANEVMTRYPDAEVMFVGTKTGLEATLVPRAGFDITFVNVKGFQRKLSLDTIRTFFLMLGAFGEARRILSSWKPDLVVGTGGYVCGPLMAMAVLAGIPTLLHESNALPGVTTRLLAPFVSLLALNFEEAATRISSRARVKMTGNPIRPAMLQANRESSRTRLGLADEEQLVLVFFGSQGSVTMNRVMVEWINVHPGGLGCQLLFATGMKHHETVVAELRVPLPKGVQVVPYLHEMEEVLAAADLAVCRAGAMTLGELCAVGIPSLLIPSPYVADNHQEYNASALEAGGAAFLLREKELSANKLDERLQMLLEDKTLRRKMAEAARKMAKPDAGALLLALVEELVGK